MNGEEDSIYPYGFLVLNEISKEDYWGKAKDTQKNFKKGIEKKPWWKFW